MQKKKKISMLHHLLRLAGAVGARDLGGGDLLLVAGTSEAVLHGLLLDFLVGELGQLVGSAHVADVLGVTLGEDDIDLLQTAVGGLGVEEPDEGDEQAVEDGEEQVSTPADVGDHDGGDHDNQEVEEPVAAGRDSVGLGTGLDGGQLSRVQPGQRQPSGTESGHVEEQTEDSTLGSLLVTRDQTGKGDNHGNALKERSTQEKLATTDLFNEEPGESGKDSVDNHVDTTNDQREVLSLVKGVLEQHREIVDDSVATTELLEDLRGGTDNHTTEVLGAATSEKVTVSDILASGVRTAQNC